MFKFFKEWYESHLTDPNQVALALIIISITLITYILLSTVVPILVAIILAYMLDGLVVTVTDKYKMKRSSSVLVVYSSFIAVSLATVLVLVPLMLNQISLFIKSLPRMLERGKELLYSSSDSNSFITSEQSSNIISAINAEISSIGSSIISYSLSSAGSLIETAVYFLIVHEYLWVLILRHFPWLSFRCPMLTMSLLILFILFGLRFYHEQIFTGSLHIVIKVYKKH